MLLLRALEFAFGVMIIAVVLLELVVPLLRGRPVLPSLGRKARLAKKKGELEDVLECRDLQDDITRLKHNRR